VLVINRGACFALSLTFSHGTVLQRDETTFCRTCLVLMNDWAKGAGPDSCVRPTTEAVRADGPAERMKHDAMAGTAAAVSPLTNVLDARTRSI